MTIRETDIGSTGLFCVDSCNNFVNLLAKFKHWFPELLNSSVWKELEWKNEWMNDELMIRPFINLWRLDNETILVLNYWNKLPDLRESKYNINGTLKLQIILY